MLRPVDPTSSQNIKKKLQNEMTVRLTAVDNAANRNAVAVQNDVSARLNRIETAIAALAQAVNQNAIRIDNQKPKALEYKRDKEWYFNDFIAKNITFSRSHQPIKRVHIWERYKETVKQADRMPQRAFFERLQEAFPRMETDKFRSGPCFQYFCYGINLIG